MATTPTNYAEDKKDPVVLHAGHENFIDSDEEASFTL